MTMLNKSERQIQFMLKQRQKILEDLTNNLAQTNPSPDSTTFLLIDKHLKQYNDIPSIIQTINLSSSNQPPNKLASYSQFWALNENIEREVEDRLRQLKEMDTQIEDIINDEFDLCNEIEQIEEDIRTTLSRKQPHHIQKAQPLLTHKTKHLQNLHGLKQQNQKLKSAKLSTIKQLLKMLQKLRTHRESRLSSFSSKKLTPEALTLLNALIKDLRQVTQHKDKTEQNSLNLDKLSRALQITNERINKTQNELLALYGQQQQIIITMQDISNQNLQHRYFEQHLFSKLQITPADLTQFLERSSLYINAEQQRKKQHEQLLQGIDTTNETIKIFRHIQDSIENQNRRKGELLKKLQVLQKEHQKQTAAQEQINDFQTELQKIEIKSQRLLKKLAHTVDQADVNAYRSVDEELQRLNGESRKKEAMVKKMKEEMADISKELFMETNRINEDFRDILSEVVPQIWLKDHDFSKEETIRDLNLYLIKTFTRLHAKE